MSDREFDDFGRPAYSPEQHFSYDSLATGSFPQVSEPIVLLAGQVYYRGDALGPITGGANAGKFTLSVLAAGDGSQTPTRILAQDTDATAGDARSDAFKSGEFDPALVRAGAGHTTATLKAAFEGTSIFFHDVSVPTEVA